MDPLNNNAYNARLRTLLYARRYAAVVAGAHQLEESSTHKLNDPSVVGNALVLLGKKEEAAAYYSRQPPNFWSRLTGEAIILARTGDRAGALRKLRLLQDNYGDAASTQYGEIYAQLGDKDRAFESLERGFAIKDAGLSGLKVDGFLDPLRSDPRFAALLREANFPA